MNRSYTLLLLSFLLLSVPLQSRVPENLAGTDIFADIDLGQKMHKNIEDNESQGETDSAGSRSTPQSNNTSRAATPEPESLQATTPTTSNQQSDRPNLSPTQPLPPPQTLALSNLNLCFGAELFITKVAQALYINGDVIFVESAPELDKKKQQILDNAGNPKIINKTCFYKEIIKKEPPTYQEINPLALLMRILFYQTPDTSSLANFKVAEIFRFKGNNRRTIYEWASFVALAVKKTYEFEQQIIQTTIIEDPKSFIDAKNGLRCNITLPKDFSFERLLDDCIKFSQRNDLGSWFVIRLLMAGTYELFGHDQELIFNFYKQLKLFLNQHFKDQESVIAQLNDLKIPQKKYFPISFIKGLSEETNSYQALLLSKEIQGIFEPLTYRKVKLKSGRTFADCFETLLRNIIVKLIIQEDGSFRTSLLNKNFKLYFDLYPTMIMQQQQEASDDWAELLVDEFAGKVRFRNKTYEINNSLRNLFITLNTIFDLKIPSLQNYEIDTEQDTPKTRTKLTQMYNALNQELGKKFNLPEEHEPTIEIANIERVVDKAENKITGAIHSFTETINFYMNIQRHGELEKGITNIKECTPEQCTKFPYFTAALNFMQNGLLAHHLISQLTFPISLVLIDKLKNMEPNNLILKMTYAKITQNYSIDKNVYYTLLGYLFNQIENPELFIAVGAAARETTENKDLGLQKYGLNRFIRLVTANDLKIFDTATIAANTALKDLNKDIQRLGLELFKALFTANHQFSFPIAKNAAINALKEHDPLVQIFGQVLLIRLVQNKQKKLVFDALGALTPEERSTIIDLPKILERLEEESNSKTTD